MGALSGIFSKFTGFRNLKIEPRYKGLRGDGFGLAL